ncbi:MAG: glycosyltransferase family 9 protein [Candidatus Odinarchaeia archaeon]
MLIERKVPLDILNYNISNNINTICVLSNSKLLPSLRHPLITYVIPSNKWFFNHTIFLEPYRFRLVYSDNSLLAKAFSQQLGNVYIKIINNLDDIITFINYIKNSKTVLIDTCSPGDIDRGIGDLLMTTPAVKWLYSKGFSVDFLVKKHTAPILYNNPYIRQVYIRRNSFPCISNYSRVIMLQRSLENYRLPRNRGDRIESICKVLNVPIDDIRDFRPILNLTSDEIKFGTQFRRKGMLNIVISLYAQGSKSRTYPFKYWNELLHLLASKYHVIVCNVLKYFNYIKHSNVTVLTGLKLREFCSVVYNSDAILSVDTGAYWVALSFKKPTFVIFSTIPPQSRIKHFPEVGYIMSNKKCQPCYDWYCIKDHKKVNKCMSGIARGEFAPCMLALTPERVYKEFNSYVLEQFSI